MPQACRGLSLFAEFALSIDYACAQAVLAAVGALGQLLTSQLCSGSSRALLVAACQPWFLPILSPGAPCWAFLFVSLGQRQRGG